MGVESGVREMWDSLRSRRWVEVREGRKMERNVSEREGLFIRFRQRSHEVLMASTNLRMMHGSPVKLFYKRMFLSVHHD